MDGTSLNFYASLPDASAFSSSDLAELYNCDDADKVLTQSYLDAVFKMGGVGIPYTSA